jgi:hypothetical protein
MAQQRLGQAMFFLGRFLRDELDLDIESRVTPSAYGILKQALYTYEEQVRLAEESIDRQLPKSPKERFEYSRAICEECRHAFVLLDPGTKDNSLVRCHFCETESYAQTCELCGEPMFSDSPFSDEDGDICDKC